MDQFDSSGAEVLPLVWDFRHEIRGVHRFQSAEISSGCWECLAHMTFRLNVKRGKNNREFGDD